MEEHDQALQDAADFEHDMIEAQDNLNAFKAAHLPIEGNWDEIFIQYGEQDDVEMALVGNNDVEMMDLVEPEEPLEPEEPKDLEDPESSQQGANAELSLAKILATALNRQQNDSELLRRLVDITSHLAGRGGNNNHHNNHPRQSTYSDFLGTHPPTFEGAREPLDADHWLHQTESKFGLLECIECQKVLFAAQQLQGSASAWWANYEASLPTGSRTEWNEFKAAFRAYFIPAGLMQRKFQEFMDLKQGGRNVLQYSEAFNHLAQYATEYVNTEEKKRYTFLCGMNAMLKERLTWQTTDTYNDLVNAAIVQEGAMCQVEEEDRKRKASATVWPKLLEIITAAEFPTSCTIPTAEQSVPCTISATREPECSCPTAC
ncbi:hypothetical protein PR202_gb29441 [Eleusine coracana subsp. coracana]|uniref:Retrotransposon gag domain-containing protein n=1 Tax=Eleusine coracana subsp. coracana TaxID=191504 RepID=A0AAV5FZM7_ELECO|nr:hypothetical protein PR202_gb29441 [Eleusine coracana subsp. coracana]